MSNDLTTIPDNVQLPAHLQGEQSNASDLVVAEGGLPRVTAKDGHFVIKKDGEEKHLPLGQPVSVVILAATPRGKHCAKVFYEGAWSADSADAPDCSSADGIRPDAGVPNRQAESCAMCPQNAWGSGHDQNGQPTKGKACSDRKELLIVQSHKIGDDIFALSVPPTSLKPLSVFGRELAKHNIPMDGVKVNIGFDIEQPKVLTFSFQEFLDAESFALATERANSADVLDHVVDPDATQSVAEPVNEPVVEESTTVVEDPAEEAEVDSAGVVWDPELHAANKSKKADGTWKAARGKKPVEQVPGVQPESQAEAKPPAGAQKDLDDILSDW